MGKLTELKPEGVWKFFEDLCGIPHGSYNEKGVSDYCVAFARERGLEVYQDEAWNVVIIKEASAGYEDAGPLILQGHLDMVCEKKPDCDIDFEKDGLRLAVDGDYVYAEGTTLGGDDGIAVAYALAILDDDNIPHPRLEVIFTTCEEVGMDGAAALDVSMLKSHTVLNMDSEQEGILLVGCAGGCSTGIHIPVERESKRGVRAVLTVKGLQGGHSGVEIDKGRANANKLLGRMLESLKVSVSFELVSVAGGLKDNAIPRESQAELLMPEGTFAEAEKICGECAALFRKEYGDVESGLAIELTAGEAGEAEVFTKTAKERVMNLLTNLPNGVIRMSEDIPGLVQTSLNLGILQTERESVVLRYAVRSSVSAEKEELVESLRSAVLEQGGSMDINGDYPAWEYRKDSPLREDCVRIYEQMFGEKPKVEAIHAGLECGLLADKIPDLDCVSMGPDILDIHTTEERMSISSVERMWRYILEILKRK